MKVKAISNSTRPALQSAKSFLPVSAEEHRRQSYQLWQELADCWERGRETLGAPTRSVSEWLVNQLAPSQGQVILEIGAGTGETGFLAASRLGAHGRLICSDFAPLMLEAAQRVGQAMSVRNVEFRLLNAEDLDLADESVDGVICRYGYMLMGEPLQALRETRRVLRPGRRLVFSVWGEATRNPWMTIPGGVMTELGYLPRRNPDGPGMFRLHDVEKLRAMLMDAGFARCEIVEKHVMHQYPDADDLWAFTSELQGPIALAIGKLDGTAQAAIRAAVEQRAASFLVGPGYRIPGLSINVVAS